MKRLIIGMTSLLLTMGLSQRATAQTGPYAYLPSTYASADRLAGTGDLRLRALRAQYFQ